MIMMLVTCNMIIAQTVNPKVETLNGILEGTSKNGVNMFLGVAYARAPVGELRWKAPQPLKKWKGVKSALTFGARAMQNKLYADMIFRSKQINEDCLYLNIWAPAVSSAKKLPVLVYFHGGGFNAGDGSEPRYDGESMAKKGIIMVTVNYRMGIFGFFAHSQLTKESKYHSSGNYGLLDQNESLRWVKTNIEAFGGDPSKVTIAGQSAGSTSVSLQLASPLSKGLFRSAIGESGSILNMNPPALLKSVEVIGEKFLSAGGFKNIAELRKLDASELLALATKQTAYFPISVDGYFLPDLPINIYSTGKQADVSLLAGWTSAEVSYKYILGKEEPTLVNYQKILKSFYGTYSEDALKFYPVKTDDEVKNVANAVAIDRFAGFSTWKWIDLHGKTNGKRVYRYLFQQPLPSNQTTSNKESFGPPHSADIPYALGNLTLDKSLSYTVEDYKTSELMQSYFVNFVKNSDPNGDGLPKWSGFQASTPQVMMIGITNKQEGEKNLKRYQFLDQIYYK